MITDSNDKKAYHFGNLKEALIEQGIELIHENGIEKFSLRKLAKKVGVSATACYNHFTNIEELLHEMYTYVIDRFSDVLRQAVIDNPCHHVTISMGVAYVNFFAEYPHYFNFLFDSNYLEITINETEITWNSSLTPFDIFVNGAKESMLVPGRRVCAGYPLQCNIATPIQENSPWSPCKPFLKVFLPPIAMIGIAVHDALSVDLHVFHANAGNQ